ncbi:MAG: PKD domain-containing protein [Candidatus Vogelbacteria bacterium]|nr:PKD domain-containing protein [Candidatus Vogelbacteria bacterium]
MKNQRFLAIILVLGLILLSPAQAQEAIETSESDPAVASAPFTASITFPHANSTYNVGDKINFTAAASGGQPPYAYTWDFGDSTQAFGQSYEKSYSNAGVQTTTLTVTDFAGHTATAAITVTVSAPVSPLSLMITAPTDNKTVLVNQPVIFSAAATGGQPPYAYTWDFGDGTQGFGQTFEKTYTQTGVKTVTVRVKDFTAVETATRITITVTASPEREEPQPTPGPTPILPLTIANIRVTDLTHNSVIIRWTTNRPATSRVIYDPVSHASIAGQPAPNFGYAYSTATTDVETEVTEHVVTVSGLAASTTYYFRVISQ